MKNFKIDIVYLWVDGADKKWRTQKEKWFKKLTGKEFFTQRFCGRRTFSRQ